MNREVVGTIVACTRVRKPGVRVPKRKLCGGGPTAWGICASVERKARRLRAGRAVCQVRARQRQVRGSVVAVRHRQQRHACGGRGIRQRWRAGQRVVRGTAVEARRGGKAAGRQKGNASYVGKQWQHYCNVCPAKVRHRPPGRRVKAACFCRRGRLAAFCRKVRIHSANRWE